MQRRQLLAAGGLATTVTLAGCFSIVGEEVESDPDFRGEYDLTVRNDSDEHLQATLRIVNPEGLIVGDADPQLDAGGRVHWQGSGLLPGRWNFVIGSPRFRHQRSFQIDEDCPRLVLECRFTDVDEIEFEDRCEELTPGENDEES